MKIDLRDLSKQVRDETGIELELVYKVSKFMCKQIKDTMEEGKYENVHLQYLGTFSVRDSRLYGLEKAGYKLSDEGRMKVEQYKVRINDSNR